MIAKINNGNSFKGVLSYVLGEGKGHEILSVSGVMETSNVGILTKQFVVQSMLSERVEKPVWHAQISFAKEDDSLIDNDRIKEIGEGYLKKMGITDNQYLIVKHTDTAHQHIHLVINRVTSEGRVLEDNMMKKRSMQAAQELEVEHDLTVARFKGRNYSGKDSDTQYVYGFRPNKQLLTNKVRSLFREVEKREFATFKQMDDFLLSNGIKLYENVTERNGKRVNYTSLDYTYRYYDNAGNREAGATNTIKTSRIGKGYDMQYFLGQLASNQREREDKVERLSKKMEAVFEGKVGDFSNKRYLFHYLYYNEIDMRLSYFKKSVERAALPKRLKANILELYGERETYNIPHAEMMKKLFHGGAGDMVISDKMTFAFSKMDREILGRDKVASFYRHYLSSIGNGKVVPDVVQRVLANKLADNNTVNYVISSMTGTKLPFHHQSVNIDLATTCFNLAQRGELARTGVHEKIKESRAVLNAYRTFREFSDSPKELLQYLAKRGIEAKMKDGSIHLFSNGLDLGMVGRWGMKELTKVFSTKGPGSAIEFSEKWLEQVFNDYHNPEKAYFYRLLDKKDMKEMSLVMKKGKSFKIDNFDLEFVHDEFKEVLLKKFEKDSHRGKISKNNRKGI